MAKLVSVYSFKAYSISTDQTDVRPVKGTAEAIKMAKGTIIQGAEETVDESLLDRAGFHRPSN